MYMYMYCMSNKCTWYNNMYMYIHALTIILLPLPVHDDSKPAYSGHEWVSTFISLYLVSHYIPVWLECGGKAPPLIAIPAPYARVHLLCTRTLCVVFVWAAFIHAL